jgi:hypothetical protein
MKKTTMRQAKQMIGCSVFHHETHRSEDALGVATKAEVASGATKSQHAKRLFA